MKLSIDIKNLLIFSLAFILFTAIGTISHEYGHIIMAKSLGYETTLHFGSMNYKSELNDKLIKIYSENQTAIENKTDFEEKADYESGVKQLTSDGLLITLSGPLQTTITGTIGLIFILWRRKRIKVSGLEFIDWVAVFLSLFWLREVFNVVISVGREIALPNGSYFGGDEKNISESLNVWSGTFSIVLGLIGLAVTVFILFKIIPNRLRSTFIVGGLIGGIFGFVLWMNVLGPKILP